MNKKEARMLKKITNDLQDFMQDACHGCRAGLGIKVDYEACKKRKGETNIGGCYVWYYVRHLHGAKKMLRRGGGE